MTTDSLKGRLYPLFARVGQGLASERRLELLDLLAQTPRHVDALARETGMSVANVSQHLRALSRAGLVDVERDGTRSIYRLADASVLRLWLALEEVAETRDAEVERAVRQFTAPDTEPPLSHEALERLLGESRVCLIDVRPHLEYEAGHLAGAICLPLDELPQRIEELPRDRQIVAYCRGRYCLLAEEAVTRLRELGFRAARLAGGWPEWLAEGRAVEGAPPRSRSR